MRAASFLILLIVLTLALPAQAQDSDELGDWSLEKLCKKTDKARHADAVLAEIERREVFSSFDLELVRSGGIDVGMGEAALRCSWGAPSSAFQVAADTLQTYRNPISGQAGMFFVHLVAGRVTVVNHIGRIEGRADNVVARAHPPLDSEKWTTFSGRDIDSNGVRDLDRIPCSTWAICSYP